MQPGKVNNIQINEWNLLGTREFKISHPDINKKDALQMLFSLSDFYNNFKRRMIASPWLVRATISGKISAAVGKVDR